MSLYNSEINFIKEFIANLKLRGIEEIPFDTDMFHRGVQCMAKYFEDHKSDFGVFSDELTLLFIKNIYENSFTRFVSAISAENGADLSFINPDYVVGVLNLSRDDAAYIIDKHRSQIPTPHVDKIAEAFCRGAQLTY